jgi:hypothetical protein
LHAYELYDLSTDIGEQKNLAQSMTEKVEAMSQTLVQWLKETNALLPQFRPRERPTKAINIMELSLDVVLHAGNAVIIGRAKLTRPNLSAVSAALTKERSGRVYIIAADGQMYDPTLTWRATDRQRVLITDEYL